MKKKFIQSNALSSYAPVLRSKDKREGRIYVFKRVRVKIGGHQGSMKSSR